MRTQVGEKIKAQSERKHLKLLLCVRVHVWSFDEFPPGKKKQKKKQAVPNQNRSGWQITGETKLTSEGKK